MPVASLAENSRIFATRDWTQLTAQWKTPAALLLHLRYLACVRAGVGAQRSGAKSNCGVFELRCLLGNMSSGLVIRGSPSMIKGLDIYS
jgi:hypothetical protein